MGGRGAEAWEELVCVHGVRLRCVWMCVHACMLFFFLFVMGTVEFGAFFYKKQTSLPP